MPRQDTFLEKTFLKRVQLRDSSQEDHTYNVRYKWRLRFVVWPSISIIPFILANYQCKIRLTSCKLLCFCFCCVKHTVWFLTRQIRNRWNYPYLGPSEMGVLILEKNTSSLKPLLYFWPSAAYFWQTPAPPPASSIQRVLVLFLEKVSVYTIWDNGSVWETTFYWLAPQRIGPFQYSTEETDSTSRYWLP